MVANRKLNYLTLNPVPFNQQNVFTSPGDFFDPAGPIPEQFALPEIFVDREKAKPFLVHFKKGTAKAEHGSLDAFDNFKKSVATWLASH